MIRVGFVFLLGDSWLGGISYFRNLLTALYALPDRKIEVVIFTRSKSVSNQLDGFPSIKVVRSSLFDDGSLLWIIRRSVVRLFSRDFLFEWLLKFHGVSVLSHSNWLPGNSRFATIGWIPDFQHVRMPEFFGSDEIAIRDESYHELCHRCSTIIVSSFDAQSDLARFDAGCVGKSEVLQFVVSKSEENASLLNRQDLEAKYRFSGKYFLLPNQFWKHKNHLLVIEALGILCREGKMVQVLATGNTSDYRHPDHFQSIMDRARELHVLEKIIHLGVIPASDLAALMRESVAIINPSFFEGWSTTVEEAKSIGKYILLSDIPVHREQNPALASYFPPDNAEILASQLWEVWSSPCPDELEHAKIARRATDTRRVNFAKNYERIVFNTLERMDAKSRE